MSGSDKLRQTITDNKIGNAKAQKVEKEVVAATRKAVKKMQATHSDYTFLWEEELKKFDIHAHLRDQFSDPAVGSNLTVNESGIKPDGGFLFLVAPGKRKFLLGAVEAKKQGTNDVRAEEGKDKQARGNAIERTCKNYVEIANAFLGEDIFSYLIFMRGCDLEDLDSSIRDRVTNMNLGCPFNELYVDKIADKMGKLHPRASLFVGITDVEAMSEKIFEMLEASMKYYLNKYAGEFNDATQRK
jgi:type II restriction enzyme